MALSPQVLVTAFIVGGAGIGAPVYFLTVGNKSATSSRLTQFLSEVEVGNKLKMSEDFNKVSCTSAEVSDNTAISVFLKEQEKNSNLYSFVKCYDTISPERNNSLLGIYWEGLIPKDVLVNIFSPSRVEGTFDMNVQTIRGKANSNDVVTTLSNSAKSSSIKLRWFDILDDSLSLYKKVAFTSIEGGEHELRDVYLWLGSPRTSQESHLGS